ncbi:hypothetical protein BGZ63DRAFT_399210 [Mariannaea sp. PMI_226]|nr:hypothetical protein BGZ63DRAFT_399210 [Mariannaea sp. PMI_226]
MADASCSTGTPFKRLIDQQGRDVSRQQDRLVGRPGAQGPGSFRSAPQAGQVHNGFNQFMNGPATLPGLQDNHAAGRVAAHAAALGGPQGPTFAPQMQAVHNARAPPAENNWATEFNLFAHQHQSAPNFGAQQAPMPLGPRHMMPNQPNQLSSMGHHAAPMNLEMERAFGYQAVPNLPNGGFAPLYGPTNGGFMDPQAAFSQRGSAETEFVNHMDDWMAVNGPRAEAQIDAILERMAEELEATEADTAKETSVEKSAAINATATDQDINVIASQEAAAITSDIASLSLDAQEAALNDLGKEKENVIDTDATDTTTVHKDKQKSEIAEAASDLLKSVQHEQGEKWKNSKFIELMTQFAEGKKDVIDNEIRVVDDNGEELDNTH